jgi:pyridoxal biosynthesis lyase PdxS
MRTGTPVLETSVFAGSGGAVVLEAAAPAAAVVDGDCDGVVVGCGLLKALTSPRAASSEISRVVAAFEAATSPGVSGCCVALD